MAKRSPKRPIQSLTKALVPVAPSNRLVTDLRSLIESAREQTARAVNSTLVLLYWQIGKRIREDGLKNSRAEYGKEILQLLFAQLTMEYGSGFARSSLSRMMTFAEVFPDERIVAALSQQLSWSHFIEIIPLEGNLKRDFYAEMCPVERWNVRSLQQKIGHHLFERTALTKMPDNLIERDLDVLCGE